MKRMRLLLIAGLGLVGALALLSATQPWASFKLELGAAAQDHLSVTGQEFNQSLSPLALAVLAGALALTIAGKVFRRVLGVVLALLGAGISAVAITVLIDPSAASLARVTKLTGLAGGSAQDAIAGTSLTVWPIVTAALGVLVVLLGVLVLAVSGRWATAGRKYETSTKRVESDEPDRIADWDALSDGDDPSGADPDADEDAESTATGAADPEAPRA